jgi:hypothetical protein
VERDLCDLREGDRIDDRDPVRERFRTYRRFFVLVERDAGRPLADVHRLGVGSSGPKMHEGDEHAPPP